MFKAYVGIEAKMFRKGRWKKNNKDRIGSSVVYFHESELVA